MPLTLELAERITAASKAKAEGLGIRVSIITVDAGGHVVTVHRMDGASWLTVDIATAMAYTAAAFKTGAGNLTGSADQPWFRSLTILTQGKVLPAGGGIPIEVAGEIVGAIGVSGGSDAQDKECSEAGLQSIA
jgi:cob(I)alamin adenosyltransferase